MHEKIRSSYVQRISRHPIWLKQRANKGVGQRKDGKGTYSQVVKDLAGHAKKHRVKTEV